MFVLYNACGQLVIFSLFWHGAMGHVKIFHNYPESFMVVVFFNHIQKVFVRVHSAFSLVASCVLLKCTRTDDGVI